MKSFSEEVREEAERLYRNAGAIRVENPPELLDMPVGLQRAFFKQAIERVRKRRLLRRWHERRRRVK